MLILQQNRPGLCDTQDMFGEARPETLAVVDAFGKLRSAQSPGGFSSKLMCDCLNNPDTLDEADYDGELFVAMLPVVRWLFVFSDLSPPTIVSSTHCTYTLSYPTRCVQPRGENSIRSQLRCPRLF